MTTSKTRKTRTSRIQKTALKFLAHVFVKDGIKQVKSTDLNAVINKIFKYNVAPTNFRVSCAAMQEQGLIIRSKIGFDWYITITLSGFDVANGARG